MLPCKPTSMLGRHRSLNGSFKSSTINRNLKRKSRKPCWRKIMNVHREIAHRIDPGLWVREILGVTPAPWQETFLRAPRGASILALTARQVGKTTTAAWAIAHAMQFSAGSLSVIVCPAQRQSGEAVRRVRESLVKADLKLKSDNVYGLEL